MGYVLCTSRCYQCKRLFSYNPNLVPSLTIDGEREPFCLACVEASNPTRIKNGFDPIVPLPGAYDACPEEDL